MVSRFLGIRWITQSSRRLIPFRTEDIVRIHGTSDSKSSTEKATQKPAGVSGKNRRASIPSDFSVPPEDLNDEPALFISLSRERSSRRCLRTHIRLFRMELDVAQKNAENFYRRRMEWLQKTEGSPTRCDFTYGLTRTF